MLGFLEKYEFITSWILLPIETIFLFFLLKEFNMTRKSFEWQQEEREKSKDEEAIMRLKRINQTLRDFVHSMAWSNNYKITILDREIDNILKQMTKIQTNLAKYRGEICEKDRQIEIQYCLDLEKQLKEKNSQRKQLFEELRRDPEKIKALFFKSCKEYSVGYLNNLERDELDLIDFLIKHNYFDLHVNSQEELSRILKDSEKWTVLPEFISRNNIDRKAIEKLYYKMFFYAN